MFDGNWQGTKQQAPNTEEAVYCNYIVMANAYKESL